MRRADIEVPNPAVDVDSWAGSACYPRGSFYPLSHGPSTRHRGITKPDFRPCSACRPRSQAPLCLCTLRPIAIRPEGTIGRLRYSLGGDRPSQTTHQPRSPPGSRAQVRTQHAARVVFHRCLPAARKPRFTGSHLSYACTRPRPTASCSKAPRGLFVLPRVARIFTGPSISPGPSSRQRPDRYAFRAGRNLPDKEFRYLRTVIVTAAVYRGFGSELAPLPLTFRHWAGISPYTSASAFAGTCGFGKQSPGPALCGPLTLHGARPLHATGAPLLPKLRG